jgi:hypothetical protein
MTETNVTEAAAAAKSSTGWKKLAEVHGMGTRLYKCVASELRPGDMNTRFWETAANRAKVAEFAKSILENSEFDADGNLVKSGVLESVDAFNDGSGQMVLDAGETRWRAVRLLEGFDVLTGETVEARVKSDTITFQVRAVDPKLSRIERRFNSVLSNNARDFTDLEYAAQIKAFLDDGVPQQTIAERLGREPTWVSHINKLNKIVPDNLLPLLREDLIKTTTVIEVIEEHGPEKAAELILAEIEAGKGAAAADYEEAMTEARNAKAEVDRFISTGTGTEVTSSGPGRKPPTQLEQAQRRLAAATNKAGKAKDEMERGRRVTGRAVKARATKPQGEASATGGNGSGKVSKANYAALLDAVRFAASKSAESLIIDAMNDALKRCGHPIVEFDPAAKPEGSAETETEAGPEVAENAEVENAEVTAEAQAPEAEAVAEVVENAA